MNANRRQARRLPSALTALLAAVALFAVACHHDMYEQPKMRPLEPTPFFADGNSSRPLIADTVPRAYPAGHAVPVSSAPFPLPVTAALIERGHERFDIYCSPCHGVLGNGRGVIVARGFPPPPSFHIARLRSAPPSHFVDVMTNGFGVMYSYRDRVPLADRWAIAAYIRALQASQNVPAPSLTPQERSRVEEGR